MIGEGDVTLAVTGATGFIGRAVLKACAAEGVSCRALSRSERPSWAPVKLEWHQVSSYSDPLSVGRALDGVRYVLHLADDADRSATRPVDAALEMASNITGIAQAKGLSGAILASSLYASKAQFAVSGSYEASKLSTERIFLGRSGLKVVVLRLPPVYGPGGKGGFSALARLVQRGAPLPLGSATAPRVYLSSRNLASLVIAMVRAGEGRWAAAAGTTFEPSDGQEVSTRDLVRHIATQLAIPAKLIPVPVGLLRLIGRITGTGFILAATSSVTAQDVGALEEAFDWHPIEAMPQSLSYLSK